MPARKCCTCRWWDSQTAFCSVQKRKTHSAHWCGPARRGGCWVDAGGTKVDISEYFRGDVEMADVEQLDDAGEVFHVTVRGKR